MIPHAFEAVENQIEPERERALVAVAGLDVLTDVLGQVWILVDWKVLEKLRRHLRELFLRLDREALRLEREAQDVADQDVVAVIGQVLGEAGLAKGAQHELGSSHAVGAFRPPPPEARRPGVAQQNFVGRDRLLSHPGFPVGSVGRLIDLAHDRLDDAVEDLVLVGHMVVERHRLDAELLAELAHAEGLDAPVVGEPGVPPPGRDPW